MNQTPASKVTVTENGPYRVDGSIRNLAALETRKCKFITGLARVFADTVISEAEAARTAGTMPADTGPTRANMAEITAKTESKASGKMDRCMRSRNQREWRVKIIPMLGTSFFGSRCARATPARP